MLNRNMSPVEIVGMPGHQVTHTIATVRGHRQPLGVREQVVAQPEYHPFGDAERGQLAGVIGGRGGYGDPEPDGGEYGDICEGRRGQRAVDVHGTIADGNAKGADALGAGEKEKKNDD